MLTGEIRNQVDRIWDTFWTGGISNPLEVIEQLTYLLFIKRLDEVHTLAESKANMLGKPIEKPIFDADQQHLRWSRFKNFDPKKLYTTIADQVFPFIKSMGAGIGLCQAYEGCPLYAAAREGGAVESGGRSARRHPDGGSRHQG